MFSFQQYANRITLPTFPPMLTTQKVQPPLPTQKVQPPRDVSTCDPALGWIKEGDVCYKCPDNYIRNLGTVIGSDKACKKSGWGVGIAPIIRKTSTVSTPAVTSAPAAVNMPNSISIFDNSTGQSIDMLVNMPNSTGQSIDMLVNGAINIPIPIPTLKPLTKSEEAEIYSIFMNVLSKTTLPEEQKNILSPLSIQQKIRLLDLLSPSLIAMMIGSSERKHQDVLLSLLSIEKKKILVKLLPLNLISVLLYTRLTDDEKKQILSVLSLTEKINFFNFSFDDYYIKSQIFTFSTSDEQKNIINVLSPENLIQLSYKMGTKILNVLSIDQKINLSKNLSNKLNYIDDDVVRKYWNEEDLIYLLLTSSTVDEQQLILSSFSTKQKSFLVIHSHGFGFAYKTIISAIIYSSKILKDEKKSIITSLFNFLINGGKPKRKEIDIFNELPIELIYDIVDIFGYVQNGNINISLSKTLVTIINLKNKTDLKNYRKNKVESYEYIGVL